MEGRKVTGGRCGREDLRRHVDDVVGRQTDYQDRLTLNCLGKRAARCRTLSCTFEVRIKSVWWAFDSPPAKISCARVDKSGELLGKGGFAEDPMPIDAIRRGFDILLFFLRSIRAIHEMKVGRRLPARNEAASKLVPIWPTEEKNL